MDLRIPFQSQRESASDRLVQGTLFIAGLSECGVEFHLSTLLSVADQLAHYPAWPDTKRYLHIHENTAKSLQALATVLNDNKFELVVIVNLLFGKTLTKHKSLARSLQKVVTEQGALLCSAEKCSTYSLINHLSRHLLCKSTPHMPLCFHAMRLEIHPCCRCNTGSVLL